MQWQLKSAATGVKALHDGLRASAEKRGRLEQFASLLMLLVQILGELDRLGGLFSDDDDESRPVPPRP